MNSENPGFACRVMAKVRLSFIHSYDELKKHRH